MKTETKEQSAVEAGKDDYLRCPRCGEESECFQSPFPHGTKHAVRCMAVECDLESPYFYNRKEAVKWWSKPFDAGARYQPSLSGEVNYGPVCHNCGKSQGTPSPNCDRCCLECMPPKSLPSSTSTREAVCGNGVIAGRFLVGCDRPFKSQDDIFRCYDCEVPFHRECLKKHCKEIPLLDRSHDLHKQEAL